MIPLSIIIPAKDGAPYLATMFRSLHQQSLDLDTVQVIFVDDGSTDETHLAAAGAGALVVRHHANQGKAAALTTGVARVREVDVVDGTDADGTDAARDTDPASGSTSTSTCAPSPGCATTGRRSRPGPRRTDAPTPAPAASSCRP